MPKGKSKEELKKQGEKTRFGQPGGPDPRKVTKNGCPKHSIQAAVRYLASKTASEVNRLGEDNEPTMAQIIAATAYKKGSKGDIQAIGYLTERIDGKVAQVNVNAEFESIINATDEELDDLLARLGQQATVGNGDVGEETTGESEGQRMEATSGAAKRSPRK